jgi:hypothetical protein
MRRDESGTLARLREYRKHRFEPALTRWPIGVLASSRGPRRLLYGRVFAAKGHRSLSLIAGLHGFSDRYLPLLEGLGSNVHG